MAGGVEAAPPGCAVRPRPLLPEPLPLLRLRGLQRPCRTRAAAAASSPSWTPWPPSCACAPTRSTATFGPPDTPIRPPLASVYLGGGTPSLLAPGAVAALLELIEACFGLAPDAEVTLEANPGPDDLGDLAGFRAAGVVRLSLGAQSLAAAELRRLGRRHTPADVPSRSAATARAAGIASLSLDLLYDLPGQTLATWAATVERALDLAPDHLSAYALTLDDPDAEGPDRRRRRPPAGTSRRAPLARGRLAGPRIRTARPTCMRCSTSASRPPAWPGTRSPTGRARASEAATTSPTGSACRTRR